LAVEDVERLRERVPMLGNREGVQAGAGACRQVIPGHGVAAAQEPLREGVDGAEEVLALRGAWVQGPRLPLQEAHRLDRHGVKLSGSPDATKPAELRGLRCWAGKIRASG